MGNYFHSALRFFLSFYFCSPHPDDENIITILLRFEHLFEAHELADSSPINIKLNEDIFKGLKITHLTEMGLGGDRPISEIGKKFHWKKVCNKIQSCQNT